ncbi:MAG: hypothetical protein IH846_17980 [Acidobacteria bacterium]|nr:hypothetical protein [Acidobacteriota bacterium]
MSRSASGNNGYVKLRREIHADKHRPKLPPTRFAVYTHLILDADSSTGVVCTSTGVLVSRYGFTERAARDALERLEKDEYIRRFPVRGRRGEYPVLVNHYEVTTGAMKGMRLNAVKSRSSDDLAFDPCDDDVDDSVNDDVNENGEVGAMTAPVYKEDKKEKEKKKNSSSPPPLPKQNGNFQLSPAPTNGKPKDEAFLKIVEKLIPFFLEKSGKRSYALHSKPGRQNGPTRLQMLTGGLKELRQAISLQCPEHDADKLMSKTESAAQLIIEEFCRSDWHMGRDPKTNGIKYDDPATYAFKNLAIMERWLGW